MTPRTVLGFLAAASLGTGCIALTDSPTRHGFNMWVLAEAQPLIADGALLTISGRQSSGKIRLGVDCAGSQAQFDIWIVLVADGGRLYDMITNGIPNNGSIVKNVHYVEDCVGNDGKSYRKYSIDLDKAE